MRLPGKRMRRVHRARAARKGMGHLAGIKTTLANAHVRKTGDKRGAVRGGDKRYGANTAR
jgi:hypothetical protein